MSEYAYGTPIWVDIDRYATLPAVIIDGLAVRTGADGRRLYSAYSLLYLPHGHPTIGAAIPPKVRPRTQPHEILDNPEVWQPLASHPDTRNEANTR
jgi:hypothetical protein